MMPIISSDMYAEKGEEKPMKNGLSNEEMISFCSQMAMILHSGISAFEGISMMLDEQGNPGGHQVLELIYQEMEQGGYLYDGMEKAGVFPEYACQMVQLGENSGRLDEVMRELADYYSEEEELSQTVRSAVSYPLFMLVMMLGVLAVLMVKVMPVFQSVFSSLGMEMSGPAGAVLQMGQAMSRYSGILLGLLAALLILCLWLSRTQKGREKAAVWMRNSRFTGKFARKTAQYRLASGMSMCISSGLDPERSLELMEKLVEDPETEKKIGVCLENMRKGIFFEEAMVEADIFDGMHNRMIRVGQRTGSLDQVLKEIGRLCQKDVSDRIWQKISMIEPTVVIILAVLVGLILLSVMLPLMSIMSQMG